MTKSYFKVCSTSGGCAYFFHDMTPTGRQTALGQARVLVKQLEKSPPPAAVTPPEGDKVKYFAPALSSWLPDPEVRQIGVTP